MCTVLKAKHLVGVFVVTIDRQVGYLEEILDYLLLLLFLDGEGLGFT